MGNRGGTISCQDDSGAISVVASLVICASEYGGAFQLSRIVSGNAAAPTILCDLVNRDAVGFIDTNTSRLYQEFHPAGWIFPIRCFGAKCYWQRQTDGSIGGFGQFHGWRSCILNKG